MTGTDIYKAASAHLYEKPGDDEESRDFSVPFLNQLLVECLNYENSVRAFEEKEPLNFAPTLTSLDDEIPYCDYITRVALPYGLASLFFYENLDNYRGNMYRAQYIQALGEAVKLYKSGVEDVYYIAEEYNA